MTAKSLAQADKIRRIYIDAYLWDVAVGHETFDFAVAGVIPYQEYDRYLCVHGAGEFADGKLRRTITNQADDRAMRGCQLGANGGRNGVPQRAETAG